MEVSKLTGNKVDASFIRRIERMKQDPSLQTIDALLKIFNLSLHELIEPISRSKSLSKKTKISSESASLIKKLPLMKRKDIKILDNFAKLLIFWKSYSGAKRIVSYYDRSLRFR